MSLVPASMTGQRQLRASPAARLGNAAIAILAACAVGDTIAAMVSANPDDYLAKVAALKPGDILTLSSGAYRQGLPLHGLSGTADRPITIQGTGDGSSVRFVARPHANTISIKNAAYLVIRSLTLDGAGQPVDAVKAEGTSKFAHHITLEDLTIVGHGINQQVVGISTKCPAWDWVIRDNEIRGAGTGMYLGNSDGSAPFVAGLIEHNLIVDTIGYNLQIKHQTSRPELPGMPASSSRTVIRGNVFSKANGGSSGRLARPNVLLGHFPLSGAGADDEYRVYGNFFHENPNESLMQAEGNMAIHDNIFFNGHGDAVRIRPHHAPLRGVVVRLNTIVARGIGMDLRGEDQSTLRDVEGNAVFAGSPIVGGIQRWNVTGDYEAARDFLVAPFAKLGELDFSPRSGALDLSEIANGMALESEDFYGRRRASASAGAIVPAARVPWRLGLIKQPKGPGATP